MESTEAAIEATKRLSEREFMGRNIFVREVSSPAFLVDINIIGS